MAINYPGPYQLRVFYTAAGLNHVLRLNFDTVDPISIGDAYNVIEVIRPNATPQTLDSALALLLADMEPLYNLNDATIDRSEVWEYEPESFEATYLTGNDISDSGSSASATVPAAETVYTFRTAEGGVMRVHLMESTEPPSFSQAYADMSALQKSFVDNFLGSQAWCLARDTSYPVAFLKMHPGQSEALFKRRYRL